MNVDVLAFGPHPDDVELFCGGTVAKLVHLGRRVGLIDMTRGELGTRGNRETRDQEAADAADILGVDIRENLDMPDGGLNSRDYNQRDIIVQCIRKHRPQLILAPEAKDRHPDHKQGMELVAEAVFLANVGKYPSSLERHKTRAVMYYPMWWHPEPDLIVDVSEFWDVRMKAVRAYQTQFSSDGTPGPDTFLAQPKFIEWVDGRGSQFGAIIGVKKGEAFTMRLPIPVDDPFELLVNGTGEANP
ncbi:bacillithiol biosynthesis deacetylase BshB1 [bacterium]|nr:bacillithiol biosynthesis deacetylase BshB1 [bacterium]